MADDGRARLGVRRDVVASVVRPIRGLVGFLRVAVPAAATRAVSFRVDPSRLAFHRDDCTELVVEPGEFAFHVGGTSDARHVRSISVELSGPPTRHLRRNVVPTTASVA